MPTRTQIEEFLRDIEPSTTTKGNASAAHTTLRGFLREDADFRKVHLDTFLAGSYRRDSALRPQIRDGKESRPDVDIIVVTNHTRSDSPKAVLELLRKTLGKEYELKEPPN